MNEQLFIKPEECLAAEVSTLMLTKKYFDKYLSKVENKQIIENLIEFQINLPIIWINQEHSFNVQEIKKNSSVLINACDGLYTQCSLQALAIKTADCLPLILSSKDGQEISALHVGWRGLQKGIIENALSFFKCDLKDIMTWMAPCISAQNYQVGEDVYASFISSDNKSISSFKPTERKDKWLFSLTNECTRRLERFNIKVIANKFCTFRDKEFFYSFRRDQSLERMVTLVWRNNE